MAQNTEAARKRGGSPTALLEYTARGLEAPRSRHTWNWGRWCGTGAKAQAHLRRHIIEAGDLVGTRAPGEQGALRGVQQLLEDKQPIALGGGSTITSSSPA